MYDVILVPTDGSEHATRAAEHGTYLARRFDASVHVISVADVREAGGVFDAGGLSEEFLERLEAERTTAIDAVTEAIGDDVPVTTAVLRGDPSSAILEYADEHGVDAVAMGTRGRTGLRRYIAGSVTERVLRLAAAPVLTVRATERTRVSEYDEVLVPTDGSEPAAAAVDHALAIAARTDARVHAMNVVDLGAVAAGSGVTPPTEVVDRLESEGESAVESVAERARDRGIEAVTEVREGLPATELLEYAETSNVDLIAMGTAGRTGVSRYLLGSTTERVVRHAETPVLAVNARERES